MKVVWYVDNDKEMIQAISLLLGLLEYETRSFLNARLAAEALLAGELPDILFLDINMPEVSGIDLLEFIRRSERWDQIPIVMLSSEAADVQIDQAMGLGADAYITKPVMLDELENALQLAIQKRKRV
jgi:two-component system chemotaxis response regulator CheY